MRHEGSGKCHANSIPAALSKLSCSAGWHCFSYYLWSYPPEQPARLKGSHFTKLRRNKIQWNFDGESAGDVCPMLRRQGSNDRKTISCNADGSSRCPLNNCSSSNICRL